MPRGFKPIEIVKGRFIVGAGKGKGLSERVLGDTGGEEKHQLTINECLATIITFVGTRDLAQQQITVFP
ncbi:hypothetical protein MHK_001537 [Candidatus Magnetomorum sp. HK-1]|nr:hypothetical protein MHK_001537 [Candidatus Magnetomorum sp. HK-1]